MGNEMEMGNEKEKIKRIVKYVLLIAAFILSYELINKATQKLSFFLFDTAGASEVYMRNIGAVDAMSSLLLTVIFFLFMRKLFSDKGADAFTQLDRKQKISYGLVMGFGVGSLSTIWLFFTEHILTAIPYIEKQIDIFTHAFDDIEAGPYIWTLLSIAIMGPIVEEYLFRGLIFNCLEKICAAPWFPILLSGLMFGIWHGNFIQSVYTAIIGIILGFVYYMTRDIRLTIFMHIINNAASALPPPIDTEPGHMAVTILSFAMLIPTVYLLYKLRKNSSNTLLTRIES